MPNILLEKDQFWFQSPLFEIEPGEDADTNPQCYGRALANWLATAIRSEGVDVDEVFPEDWGWCIMVKRKPFLLWIGCGNVGDNKKNNSGTLPRGEDVVWTCIAVAEVPLFRRLFGAPDTAPELSALYSQVKRIVAEARGTIFVDEP